MKSATTTSDQDPSLTASPSASLSVSEGSGVSATTPTVGALAGGIVGAFFAGLIIALLAAYMFGKHRKKHSSKRKNQRGSPSADYAEYNKTSVISATPAAWERYLPQPVDDKAMRTAVSSILDQVALHVTNVYSKKSIPVSELMHNAMTRIDTGVLPEPPSKLMIDLDLQAITIKHCITHMLTAKMMPGDNADDLLLPAHLAVVPTDPTSGISKDRETQGALNQSRMMF